MAAPMVVAAVVGGLMMAVDSIVGRVLVALGIGVVSYTGVSAALSKIQQMYSSGMGSAGQLAELASYMQLDTCMAMTVAAVTARLMLNGIQSGTLKRWVLK